VRKFHISAAQKKAWRKFEKYLQSTVAAATATTTTTTSEASTTTQPSHPRNTTESQSVVDETALGDLTQVVSNATHQVIDPSNSLASDANYSSVWELIDQLEFQAISNRKLLQQHGQVNRNICMRIAAQLPNTDPNHKQPLALATAVVTTLLADSAQLQHNGIEQITATAPGFINMRLQPGHWATVQSALDAKKSARAKDTASKKDKSTSSEVFNIDDGLLVEMVPASFDDECYQLYRKYAQPTHPSINPSIHQRQSINVGRSDRLSLTLVAQISNRHPQGCTIRRHTQGLQALPVRLTIDCRLDTDCRHCAYGLVPSALSHSCHWSADCRWSGRRSSVLLVVGVPLL
jgi:hypothetical protein